MDAGLLDQARCYFGGGTQLVMSYGEFRESRDIGFIVSRPHGLRGTPSLLLVDRQGRLRRHSFGAEEDMAIAVLIAER